MSKYYSPAYLKDIQMLCVTEKFRNIKTSELIPLTSLINRYTSNCILFGESYARKFPSFSDWLNPLLTKNGGDLEKVA